MRGRVGIPLIAILLALLLAAAIARRESSASCGGPGDIFVSDKEYEDFKKKRDSDAYRKRESLEAAKGPREFEGIWYQAWLSTAEGGADAIECTIHADTCLEDFKRRFRK